ncbi:MAG: hypothetical protein GXO29_03935 [Thermotogae bacterium]|nr:hypothetical protein [Thermotogota bacterium]
MFPLLLLSLLDSSYARKPEVKSVFVPPPDYRINPGDRLLITAYSRRVSVIQYEAFVDNSGAVPLEVSPVSRPASVRVEGLTIDSAQKVLLGRFRKFVPALNFVSIQLISPAKFYVMLRGNFDPALNGYMRTNGLTRLSDVVLDEKVALPYSALSRVRINGDTFNLWKFVKEGDLTQNPLLGAYDTIFLERTDSVIYAVGDFSDGNYWTVEWSEGDRVYDILLKLRQARRIYVLRNVLLNGRKASLETPVNVGDTLSFDFAIPFVIVLGEVVRPGGVQFAPHKTVQDYIIEAYGFTERANRWNIRVKHPGSTKMQRVSLDYRPGPGDVILVGSSLLTMRDIVFLGPSIVSAAVLIYTTFFRK